MSNILTVVIISLFIFPIDKCQSENSNQIIFKDLTIKYDPEYGNISSIVNISNNSVLMTIKKEIEKCDFEVEIKVKTDSSGYNTFFERNMHYCDFLGTPSLSPIFNMSIYQSVIQGKQNKWFTSCPLLPVIKNKTK